MKREQEVPGPNITRYLNDSETDVLAGLTPDATAGDLGWRLAVAVYRLTAPVTAHEPGDDRAHHQVGPPAGTYVRTVQGGDVRGVKVWDDDALSDYMARTASQFQAWQGGHA